MPAGDRTGPVGYGPMTGHRAGFCAGYDVPGYENPVPGQGFRQFGGRGGRGHGMRHRHWFLATGMPRWMRGFGPGQDVPPQPAQEADALKQQATWLQNQLEAIQARIAALEKQE